jgi:5'-nucleotidase
MHNSTVNIVMNRRFAINLIPVLVVTCLAACATTPESTVSSAPGLTFVHLNDTYRVGAVEDGSKGGFGRVVTVIRELQQQGRDVRVLHAGDFLYPSLESQLWNGLQMVDAMNYLDDLAPMYMTAGNHEFDRRTPEHLVNAIRESRFDWLGDNFSINTGNPDADAAIRRGFTFEQGGKTIGIFSLMLHADDGGNDRDYLEVDKDYYAAAEEAISTLEAAGADAIIGLTHLHVAVDIEIARLKEAHPRFVFIVGGHDHEPKYSRGGHDAATVMKGASNARSIWVIDLLFDASGMPYIEEHPFTLDTGYVPDEDYAQVENKWRDRLLEKFPFLEAKVGMAAAAFNVTEERVRSAENGWANFIVDQMRGAFGEPEADLAFINSGSLRIDDYVADDILFEDIGRTFGFSSFLRYMTITGGDFRRVMENGYRGSGSQGYFPQISGFRVCVDRSRDEGARIASLQVPADSGWTEIEDGKEYTLVVPDFLYRGGDGYELPQDPPASRPGSELKYLVLDAILRAQGEGRAVGAVPDLENPRQVELGPGRTDCW